MSVPSQGVQPPAPPHPDVKAILICDQAIREEGTGKVSLIGIFEKVFCLALPAALPSLCVYVKMIDAQGDYDLVLELIRQGDMMVLGRGEVKATIDDRLEHAELVFNLGGISFDQLGPYEVRLTANGRYLATKSFHVIQLPQAAR